jgi:hypothetical protein
VYSDRKDGAEAPSFFFVGVYGTTEVVPLHTSTFNKSFQRPEIWLKPTSFLGIFGMAKAMP